MSALALVDRLRALGPAESRAFLESLTPSARASLRFNPSFWLRPTQRVEPPYATIEIFDGERGTGKSHAARELFTSLLPQAQDARVMVATDGSVAKTVYNGASGLKRWTPPHIRCDFVRSAGYAGDILYGSRTITVTSAAAPVGGIGPGYGLTWADDVAAWIEAVGAEQAARAWNHLLKSNREEPGIVIVSTTGRGVEFLWRLLDAEEARTGIQISRRVHRLGAVENNAGNLAERYMRDVVPGLRAAGEWEECGDPTGAFAAVKWPEIRVRSLPRLTQLVVSVDPAKSSRSTSCEVGIEGLGMDDRATIYGVADRSDKMGADTWPAAAWDMHDELAAQHPGAPIRFVVENNAGGEMPAALLRAEEKIRRARRGLTAQSIAEIREVTSRPRDSKVKRAMPVVALARGGQVRMLEGLGVLEGQLSKLTDAAPGNDRADAFVHGARDLAGLGEASEPVVDPLAGFGRSGAFVAAQTRMPPRDMAPDRGARDRGGREV